MYKDFTWRGVFKLWAYNYLICSLMDVCLFCFNVSFDNAELIISDSVYVFVNV